VSIHNLHPKGVLHVGAHEAEEFDEYARNGFADTYPIIWVEAQKDLCARLRNRLDPKRNKIYSAVAWSKSGIELEFNVTNKTASSSIFDLKEHKIYYPDIEVIRTEKVVTSRLDEILKDEDQFDFLVLDIQGAEFEAIFGLGDRIKDVNWILTEVSKRELYTGSKSIYDIEQQLNILGFKKVFVAWDKKAGWGDSLFARPEKYNLSMNQKFSKKLKN
jgi:FkbM family methyltransferase